MNIRVYRSKTKKVEAIPLEEYLRGVVPAEIGQDAPLESMKAQAIACRTFAARHIKADRTKSYDVTDTTADQVYNSAKITARSDEAVKATTGIVMANNGDPIGAWFSSSNGGRIKSAHEKWGGKSLPYSVAKDDPWDKHGGGGHGVGMSQYGAMAMAEAGKDYKEILAFYYNNAFQFAQIGDVYMRTLRKGSKGDDVKTLQKQLMARGYTLPKYGADGDFGNETVSAVKKFQRENKDANGKKLTVDGIVGKKTWDALFAVKAEEQPKPAPKPTAPVTISSNIGAKAAEAIAADLADVSDDRKQFALEALKFAYDPEVKNAIPRSLYVWGANLYNSDGTPNVMTADKLRAAFKKYPSHFTTAARGMMLATVIQDPNITGSDCSGGVVGLLRHFGKVKPNFDANANGLCGSSHSKAIKKSQLIPADWVGRSGHIGIYVGGGYVVEWYGQDYGAQLTKLDTKRKAYNFVEKKTKTGSEWTRYRRPKYF